MMDIEERDDRVMALAAEALNRLSGDRERFLQQACQNDPGLYQEVSEVVSWEERMGGFLRRPLIDFIDLDGLDRPFKPGQLVADRYEIIREVGDGGMGVVYEANDLKLEHRIAIKCPKLGYNRLPPELRSALRVRHRNICLVNDIHKVEVDLGELEFLTMEFLDGETLHSRLTRGRLEPDEALQIARQLCAGLAEAHHRGVLHRDLKPTNVILSSEENKQLRVVITDFGLAADRAGNTDLLGGTASYMAPEMKEHRQTSTASDVYALGVILYEMVTGQKPFQEVSKSNGNVPAPVAPGKLVRHLPRIWNDAILPCFAPHPADRPSVEEVLAVLNRQPLYRRPWVAVAAVLVLVTAGTFLWRPVYEYLRLPDITLVILPIQGKGDVQQLGDGVMRNVAKLLAQEPQSKIKFQLVPSSIAEKQSVASPEQAKNRLNATHVLEVNLSRGNGDIDVEAAVVDTKTSAHVRGYSGHFAERDLDDLSGGLASLVSLALHLPRAAMPETISPAAKDAYDNGNNYLGQDGYSFDQAITQFQKAARLDPHSPLPFAGLAEAYIAKLGVEKSKLSLSNAQLYLREANRLNPDSPRVLLVSSSLNILAGQNAQAAEDCIRVLELEPENAEAWVRSGFANEELHLSDKAQVDYRKAIDLAPSYYKGYEYLGAFKYYSEANYAEAEKLFRKEVELAPGRPDGYASLGALFTAQGKYPEAEKVYRAALQTRETPENLNNLGVNLVRQKRDADALPLYERAAVLNQSSEIYRINLGDSHRRLGHIRPAIEAYKKALTLTSEHLLINPSSGLTRAYMAYCLARLGRENAEFEIGQALGSARDDQQVILPAVLTYEVLGKRDLALSVAAKASSDIKKEIEHHPDLADFNQNSRFTR